MTLWVGSMDVGWGQECRYSNPEIPTSESMGACYFEGGTVSEFYSICSPFSLVGDPTQDMTITFGGDLIVGDLGGGYFQRCTLLFEKNTGIVVPFNDFQNPQEVALVDCILNSCDPIDKWNGISPNDETSVSLLRTKVINAITGIGPYFYDVTLDHSDINDCDVGVDALFGPTSDDFPEKTFTVKNSTIFDGNDIGIRISGSRGTNGISINGATFRNGNIGIKVENLAQRNSGSRSFKIESENFFTNLNTGILIERNFGGSIKNQEFTSCLTGISVKELKDYSGSQDLLVEDCTFEVQNIGISVASSGTNTDCLVLGNSISKFGANIYKSAGIFIKDSPNFGATISFNPMIFGFTTGIKFDNVGLNRYSLTFNTFVSNNYALSYTNNTFSGGGLNRVENSNFLNNDKIYISSASGLSFKKNTLNAVSGTQPSNFPNATGFTFKENAFNGEFSGKSIANIENGSGNTFCCNTIKNTGSGLLLSGTNPATSLNVTTFEGSELTLEESMIGDQIHTGNRWKGATSKGSLIGAEPTENLFEINQSQGNATLGFMQPNVIDPVNQAAEWFINNTNGNATGTCSNNCGLMLIPNGQGPEDPSWVHPPTSIPNLGPCYPTGFDRDGDGICDSNDPDPNDPCYPLTQDSDGICDVLDPDVLNSCNPISIDTDHDGICDGNDPDPNDPCVPNGVDTDGDGVCDILDPDPNNPNPYNIPSGGPGGYTNQDSDGAPYSVEGYSSAGYLYSVASLEDIASRTIGTTDYDELNYVESMAFLHRILHTSPYFRIVSNKLNVKYNQLNASSIAEYDAIERKISNGAKIKKQLQVNYSKKSLYLNRLKNVSNRLNINVVQDSLYSILIDSVSETEFNKVEIINQQIDSTRHAKSLVFSNAVANLPTDYNRHTALKEFYPIYVANILNKQPLNQAQISSLLIRANSCPLIYGEAVHRSREILIGAGLYDPQDFTSNCQSTVLRQKNKNIEDEIAVFPNPTLGIINFTNTGMLDQVVVSDISGKELIKLEHQDLRSGIIDLSQFSQSICFLTFVQSNGVKIHKKVIVIK